MSVIEIFKEHQAFIKQKYGVKSIGVFGSFARGEAKEDSDVDVLVEYIENPDFFGFLELEEYLEGLLGRKVDLVTKDTLKPYIGRGILEEVLYL